MLPRSPISKQVSKQPEPKPEDLIRHLTFYRSAPKEWTWSSIEGHIPLPCKPPKYHLTRIHLGLRKGQELLDFRHILRVLNENQQRIEERLAALDPDDDPMLR